MGIPKGRRRSKIKIKDERITKGKETVRIMDVGKREKGDTARGFLRSHKIYRRPCTKDGAGWST